MPAEEVSRVNSNGDLVHSAGNICIHGFSLPFLERMANEKVWEKMEVDFSLSLSLAPFLSFPLSLFPDISFTLTCTCTHAHTHAHTYKHAHTPQLHVAKRNGIVYNSETRQMTSAPLFKPEVTALSLSLSLSHTPLSHSFLCLTAFHI